MTPPDNAVAVAGNVPRAAMSGSDDSSGGLNTLLMGVVKGGPFAVLAGYLIWQQAAIVNDFKEIHTQDMAQLRAMDDRNHAMSVQQIELQKEIRDELRRVINIGPGSPRP